MGAAKKKAGRGPAFAEKGKRLEADSDRESEGPGELIGLRGDRLAEARSERVVDSGATGRALDRRLRERVEGLEGRGRVRAGVGAIEDGEVGVRAEPAPVESLLVEKLQELRPGEDRHVLDDLEGGVD